MNTAEEKKNDSKQPKPSKDWSDYRNHLATADKEGHRLWIYPRKPGGRFYRARTYVS